MTNGLECVIKTLAALLILLSPRLGEKRSDWMRGLPALFGSLRPF
uniref:Uncharacterized protein n=1 Tax=Anguilla anguilla TaxID=7936 RepID=A0A0E9SL79_ANGAN